ncbi:MAG: cobalamin biosynthesis protein CbiX, partial [Akkermansiaceae bacterium]|nr:cobalamin biosynthesis protein CbiX [Akkermansiaceae bacterium]
SDGFEDEVILAMLFISPGRHAGPGGDIAQICEAAEGEHKGLRTHMSDLFATHPAVVELLMQRYRRGLDSDPVAGEVAPPQAGP